MSSATNGSGRASGRQLERVRGPRATDVALMPLAAERREQARGRRRSSRLPSREPRTPAMSGRRPTVASRPPATIATRLQSVSASEQDVRAEEDRRAARRAARRISARMSRRPSGSSPDIGSSRKITSGSLTSAWAMPTRCTMPFEYFRSCMRRSAPRPTWSSSRPARARQSAAAYVEQRREVVSAAPRPSGCRRSTGSPGRYPIRRRTVEVADGPPENRRPGQRSGRPAASAASASWSCRRRWARESRRPRRARPASVSRSSAR